MDEGHRLLERILDGAQDLTDLPLALLQDITDNFSEGRKIGQGGFGVGYKGVLGERIVAVKRFPINENTFDDRLFRREFVSLCNSNHRNLLGFCSNTYQKTIQDAESGELRWASVLERMLCFEYISGGTLDKHITVGFWRAVLTVLEYFFSFFLKHRVPTMEHQRRLLERILDGDEDPTDLPLALLQDITDNFSEGRKIGQGGFGVVYKGVVGERIVAVKRIHINENTFDDRLFRQEFVSLWNTNHRNVVRFLGFCSSTHQKTIQDAESGEVRWASVLERLLCFEYIRNGGLDTHITDELRGLEWETRYEIIIGICKGLRYLHKDKNIIHMDLKPENILLHNQDDKYMVPKITDFGLSRTIEKSHTVTRFGTRGYMAPEYMNYGKTTFMSDIYCLGAIIIELVTGCKDIPNKDKVLRRWRHRWNQPPTQLQFQQVTRCIEIGGQCRAENPESRPSISKIISFLSESESTYAQISPCLYKDDMIAIKLLELQIPFELKETKSFSVKLKNDTGNRMAFIIKLPRPERYRAQPDKGIVQPGSKYDVNITVHPQDMHHGDKLTVQSMKDSEGLREEDVTEHMFEEVGKVVDEVDLTVVYEPKKPDENCKRRGDTNVPAEEVPEEKKRKTVESASGKGKNNIDSSENAEAASMDISSSTHGQYTKQLAGCNFHPPESFSYSQATNMTYLVRPSDRAMDVTRGAMGSLLHKLGVLHKEFNLEASVKKDAAHLVMMQQVLRKLSDAKQDNLDDMVKLWARNSREMSYDLEDFVDGFLVYSEPDSDGSGIGELRHEMYLEKGKSQQPITDLIKHHISIQVQDEAEKCIEYKVDNIVTNATTKSYTEDPRNSAIYIEREQLIGIEERKRVLIRLLEEDGDESKLKIVSIAGLGGLGKTTLSKAVYHQIKAQYRTRAFVLMGQKPDATKILKNILYSFGKDLSARNLDLSMLLDELHDLLENKSYFIVIDDIWDSLEWNRIRPAFPENRNGSRVMITTRNQRVALECCNFESKNVYEITRLSPEHSRSLFIARVFGLEKGCPDTPKIKDILNYILERCCGMPLAIISIASLLNGEEDATWENVRKYLGARTEGKPAVLDSQGKTAVDNMNEILDLSYIHLSADLKTCLLYVCMYPEHTEIGKNDLLKQWVAEGFVTTNGGLDAEDIAENYFKSLINRCMIQPGEIDYKNEVSSCRVHDLILDLLRSKSTEENYIQVIDGSKDKIGARKIRRVLVHYDKDNIGDLERINKRPLMHVRSVLVYQASLVPYFLAFKFVRVLNLKDREVSLKGLDLTGISKLPLLRYLKVDLSLEKLKLPDQIGHLQQLETIHLTGCEVEKIPSDIVSLPRLSYLGFGTIELMGFEAIALPDGIGRMKSLRTLQGVDFYGSSVDNIKGLGELTKLTNLQIYSDQNISDEEAAVRISALYSSVSRICTSLRILTLDVGEYTQKIYVSDWNKTLFPKGSHICKLHLAMCDFERCPQWIGELHNLYSLSIRVREVPASLSIVAGLPSLAYLKLHNCTSEENMKAESVVISGTGSGAFQALKHLIVESRKTSLTFEKGAMPKLEELDIPCNIGRRLARIPVGIEHLPASTLREISLAVSTKLDDWKVKGSEHWNYHSWSVYFMSDHYEMKLIQNNRKMTTLLRRPVKLHHASAEIYINFGDNDYSILNNYDGEETYEEEGDEEYELGAYDDDEYCAEDGESVDAEADTGDEHQY